MSTPRWGVLCVPIRKKGMIAVGDEEEKAGKHEDDRDGQGQPQPDKWKDPEKD